MTKIRTIETLFKALADRNRLRILKMLEVKPMCVCEMTGVLGIAQPSVSRHLGILRNAGLLEDRKEGIWTIYALSRGADEAAAALLDSIRRWGNDDPEISADRGRAQKIDRNTVCGAKG
jgi:ArsR family transcriptional regulator, arsenate/arsenite/antimonite-responsive transcriptional repressor